MKRTAQTPLRYAADVTFHLGVAARAAKEVELHSTGTARDRAAYVALILRRLRDHSRKLEQELVT